MDISKLSLLELEELLKEIPLEISRKKMDEKRELRVEFERIASQHGFSLKEIYVNESGLQKGGGRRKLKTSTNKYRHPHDEKLSWSGRGRKPKWIAELISSGVKLESLETKGK